MPAVLAALPMYDWPEVAADLDAFWTEVAAELHQRGIPAPDRLTRRDDLVSIWSDPSMIVGQVCSLNPVRDGLGETEVVGTFAYEPPAGLPDPGPGTYYSVVVCRRDDPRGGDPTLAAFEGATIAANGDDSQSGYWSLGHHVRSLVGPGPLLGRVEFTGAHRASITAVAEGSADLAAIDVHSWRLALDHEPTPASQLRIVTTTQPTPGVVCVVSWELADRRRLVADAIAAATDRLLGSALLDRLHITGFVRRQLDEFQIVADQVEAATRRHWHR